MSNQLKEAFEELKTQLQHNADKCADTIEKRDRLYWASVPAVDIERRVDNLLNNYVARAEPKVKQKLAKLTSGVDERAVFSGDLFSKTISINGANIQVPDVDVLVYLFRNAFITQIKPLAKILELEYPGPPLEERLKLINDLDCEILKLEQEKEELHEQVKDAGLIVRTTHNIDGQSIAKPPVQNEYYGPGMDNEIPNKGGGFDMHPSKRIDRRNREMQKELGLSDIHT